MQPRLLFGLSELLVMENDLALLDFSCPMTDIPLWPQIRVPFFRMLIADLYYDKNISGRSSAHVSVMRATMTMAKSIAHNFSQVAFRDVKSDICLMTDGVANQFVDGRWFNRLGDCFAMVAPEQTLAIEDHSEWKWPFPRHHQRVLFHAPLQAINSVRSKLFRRQTHLCMARQLVLLVRARAIKELNWDMGDEREAYLTQMLSRKAAAIPYQYHSYRKMLEIIDPRVLMVGAGCYGPLSALIAAAKNMGITTAEYQHGAISAGHDAYNFAPTILSNDFYKKTLPDYFLGYGSWWNSQINAPLKKVSIGNPHRDKKLSLLSNSRESQDVILILSDGIEFDKYMEFALQLSLLSAKTGLRVVIRPHPLERTEVYSKYGKKHALVEIDQNADIYSSLRQAYAVVSEVSTGLFEAVGLAKKIFIWDTPKARFSYPDHPFQAISSAAMMFDLMNNTNNGDLSQSVVESIWAPDWEIKYKTFLLASGVVTK